MMKQEDLFKKIGLILNELNDQYQFLAQNPQQLSELELELFHANANFLADHVQIIKKVSSQQQPPLALPTPVTDTKTQEIVQAEPDVAEAQVSFSGNNDEMQEEQQIETIAFVDDVPANKEETTVEPAPEPEPETPLEEIEKELFKIDNEPSTFEFILNDHAEHEKFEFEEKSIDEIFNRPLSHEEERIIAEKTKLNHVDVAEIPQEEDDEIGPEPFLVYKEDEQEALSIKEADLDLEEAPAPAPIRQSNHAVEDPTYKPTLNELLKSQSASPAIHSTKPGITDLKQAINLNDKLLYIKDLFNGYNLAYAEAIDLANKLPNFDAADQFFKHNYAVKNNWAEKQATVDRFYELLNQRFK